MKFGTFLSNAWLVLTCVAVLVPETVVAMLWHDK